MFVFSFTGYYENWIRETIGESERTDESEGLENRYNYDQAGRGMNEMVGSAGGLSSGIGGSFGEAMSGMNSGINGGMSSSMTMSSGMASSNGPMDNNENENNVYEPASVINERSNSQVVNGTESDELTISGSFTQAPTLLNNSTSTGH